MTTNPALVKNGKNHQNIVSIDTAMQAVEQVMFDVVDSEIDILRDASRHILAAGGKRVRPRLLLLSFLASGGKVIEKALNAAAALELVHTASVVHDDINDHGVMRRGRPSVNAIWGRTFALLTGDFLFTKVYELMAPYKELNELFSQATVALVEGETLQAAAVKNNNLTSDVYFKIIGLKTAILFKIGAMLGAKLAESDEQVVNALGEYGYNIGLAFQIIDDILDLTADEKKIGKTAGLDVAQGKGLASVQDDPMNNVKQKLLEGDRISKAKIQAQTLVESAIAYLDVLPKTKYKQELISLGLYLANREF